MHAIEMFKNTQKSGFIVGFTSNLNILSENWPQNETSRADFVALYTVSLDRVRKDMRLTRNYGLFFTETPRDPLELQYAVRLIWNSRPVRRENTAYPGFK